LLVYNEQQKPPKGLIWITPTGNVENECTIIKTLKGLNNPVSKFAAEY
jgi:hypothetical protein